jgi:hypothetical protein
VGIFNEKRYKSKTIFFKSEIYIIFVGYLKPNLLHNVGLFKEFVKKCQKRGPTHVETNFSFFSQDFFGKVKNGHFFCPFFKKAESPGRKNFPPLHKKFLASRTKKKI